MVYSFCEEEGEELSGFDGLVVYFFEDLSRNCIDLD